MPNFNKVHLMGNLTRDPELRMTPRGTPVCAFGMAINRTFRGSDDETREETTFVDIEAWGKQAEIISKYVVKGGPLFVEGRLKLDSWENKEGEKRSKLKVVVENMQLLGGRGSEGGGAPRSSSNNMEQHAPKSAGGSSSAPVSKSEDIEEDVPF